MARRAACLRLTVLAMLVLTGCASGTVNSSMPAHSSLPVVVNHTRLIYAYLSYKEDASKQIIKFYIAGKEKLLNIPYQDSPPMHGPWMNNPVLSTETYASNLLPQGFNANSPYPTHWIKATEKELVAMYNGHQVSLVLEGTYPRTSGSPETALVTVKTFQGSYDIYLFKLNHRYVWDIYKIVERK